MITLNAVADNRNVQKFLRQCPDRFQLIFEKSLNEAGRAVNSLAKRKVPKEWGISKDELRGYKFKPAKFERGIGEAQVVIQNPRRVSFSRLSPAPSSPFQGQRKGGVSIMLRGQRHHFPHAFYTNLGERGEGVYIRASMYGNTVRSLTGGKRKGGKRRGEKVSEERKIIKLTTIHAGTMARSELTNIPRQVREMAQNTFNETFIESAESWLRSFGGL